jgi:hypothetical protein
MAFLRNDKGRSFFRDKNNRVVCRDGSPAKRAAPRTGCLGHSTVDQALGGEGPLRDEYEKLLANPNSTIRGLQAWLHAKGLKVSRGSVDRHRRAFRRGFSKVQTAARMAQAFCRVVRNEGAGALVEASQGAFEMCLMERLFELKDDNRIAAGEFEKWGKMLRDATANRRSVEQMREEIDRKAADAAKVIDAEIKSGATGKDVVARMREILGV